MSKAEKQTGTGKEVKVNEVVDERTVVPRAMVQACRIVDNGIEVEKVEGLPAEFMDAETIAGFPPSAKFEKKYDCVFGELVNVREGVGPNASRLYELSVPTGRNGEMTTVAVWGTTVLDRQYDSAFPPIQQGDRLAFIYIGESNSKKPGQSPAKLFQLKIKRMSTGQVETSEPINVNRVGGNV